MIPVTVLSGFLGAGKTTVLNDLLTKATGMKIAVIVNDMSEINVDALVVKEVQRSEEKLVELSNGCICCTLREDLLREVERLALSGEIDYIIIESTGISEPVPVAQTFCYIDEQLGIDLTKFCRLDTMVTVVDAYRFWHDFRSGESLLERKVAVGEEDERQIADLLLDQIEFCDVLLLNKCDLVSEEEVVKLERVLRALQPTARLYRTTHGAVEQHWVIGTELFNFTVASESAGWLKELMSDHHTPETEQYSLSSFVYRSRWPFHAERLQRWMMNIPTEVVRAKGIIWSAHHPDYALFLSQAGPSVTIEPLNYWVASLPANERAEIWREQPHLLADWDEEFGDRQTKLVLIGVALQEAVIRRQLNECLVTEEEFLATTGGAL